MFVKSLVKIAMCVHHAWLSMRRTCSVKCDWKVTLEWTLNVQENILSTFCFSLQFLYRDKTLRVCFLSSFFPKFWRGQIVPLTIFLRDNFNCSAGLAQWCGLAQTLSKVYICSGLFDLCGLFGSGWKNEEWFMCTLCLRSLYVVACLAGQWMKGRWINSVPFSVNKEANKPNELTRLVDS